MKRLFLSIGAAVLSATLTACAPPTVESRLDAVLSDGELFSTVSEFDSAPFVESCDRKFSEVRLRIVRALDAQAKRLRQHSLAAEKKVSTSDNSQGANVLQIGRYGFPSKAVSRKPGWTAWYDGWHELEGMLDAVLQSDNEVDWEYLNTRVRGLLLDEVQRLYKGFPNLGHEQLPTLFALNKDVEESSSGCRFVEQSDRHDLLLSDRAFKLSYIPLREACQKGGLSQAEDWFKLLRKQMKQAVNYWGFEKNATVEVVSGNELSIPVSIGDLVGGEEALSQYISSFWSSSDLKISLKFEEDSDPYFRFFYSEDLGARSFVVFAIKKVQLYRGTSMQSLAHEFGHVLGFADRYYTVWMPETCQYREERNNDDIMSEVDSGKRLLEHTEKLREVYLGKKSGG